MTRGVRVKVSPAFMPQHSDADARRYVFAYRIRITNESDAPVKLLTRHWAIVDAEGERHEVEGEGVIGQQPDLAPGASFEYSSFCPLATTWGTMEGRYAMRTAEGQKFDVAVARFYLVATADPVGPISRRPVK